MNNEARTRFFQLRIPNFELTGVIDMDIYCSQLGMMIEMSYCFSVNEGLPCRNIIGCWHQRADITALLKERFTEEQLKKVFGGIPKTKLQRIAESIKSAGKDKKG